MNHFMLSQIHHRTEVTQTHKTLMKTGRNYICTAWLLSDLVGIREDGFSHDTAQLIDTAKCKAFKILSHGMGYIILLWHSLSLPYNYFIHV